MACTMLAIGPCTLPSDGVCMAPKEPGTFDPPTPVFLQGELNSVTVTWDAPTDGSTVYNCMTMLFTGGIIDSRDFINPLLGTYNTGDVYQPGDEIVIYIRPENTTEYGNWYKYKAIVNPDWNSEIEVVTYLGDNITYLGELVTVNPFT